MAATAATLLMDDVALGAREEGRRCGACGTAPGNKPARMYVLLFRRVLFLRGRSHEPGMGPPWLCASWKEERDGERVSV